MIKFENTRVNNFEPALRGMRNPLNSWDKADSIYSLDGDFVAMGAEDYALAKKLALAGSDHGKFLRMITVTVDITAPFYWWKQASTYKVGTVANSCSTMHKIQSRKFISDDFSTEHMNASSLNILKMVIDELNLNRKFYLDTKDKTYWWQMIQLLPTNYNQKRTLLLNYEVLRAMYHSRKNHKLDEWHDMCRWIESLPYSELITTERR